MTPSKSDPSLSGNRHGWVKALVLIAIVGVIATVSIRYREVLTLENLSLYESQLRDAQQRRPLAVYGGAFLLYVLATGLSLPGAAVLTLAYGWYFGAAKGIPLVSFASTAGATLAFILSRYLFRDAIQRRFGDRLTSFNEALERDGPFFLFTLRLIPAVPFFVINAVMGLTPIRTWTFWWVSQLGMLAGTAVYVYAGASVPSLNRLADEGVGAVFSPAQLAQITGAFVLLGVFPLGVRFALRKWRRPVSENNAAADAAPSP